MAGPGSPQERQSPLPQLKVGGRRGMRPRCGLSVEMVLSEPEQGKQVGANVISWII